MTGREKISDAIDQGFTVDEAPNVVSNLPDALVKFPSRRSECPFYYRVYQLLRLRSHRPYRALTISNVPM